MALRNKLVVLFLSIFCTGATWMMSPGKGSHASASTPFSEVQQKDYASTANTTSHSLVFTSTPVQNNLLVITVVTDAACTTPSGFSVASTIANATGNYIFYKVAGASESTTVTLAINASTSLSACGFEFSGMATSTPFDVGTTLNVGSGVTSIGTGTTATTAQANELLVACTSFPFTGAAAAVTAWSNSFTAQAALASSGSTPNVKNMTATRVVTSTGTFSTATTIDSSVNNANGMIATFKITTP